MGEVSEGLEPELGPSALHHELPARRGKGDPVQLEVAGKERALLLPGELDRAQEHKGEEGGHDAAHRLLE
ncbi:MAG: hypothetical protein QXY39_08565, partial [Thermofilaceae archaeon]